MQAECRSCSAVTLKRFNGELAVHFPGLDGLNKPIVWVFPELTVCLNCGFAEFVVSERELRVLIEGKPVRGVAVCDDSSSGAHAA